MRSRLGKDCGQEDIIGNDEQGYHLRDWLIVEVYDEAGTLVGGTNSAGKKVSRQQKAEPALRLSKKQRWVMARLAADVKLTRRDVEQEFGISERTAKRVLGELSDAGMIEFDRSEYPGYYRLSR